MPTFNTPIFNEFKLPVIAGFVMIPDGQILKPTTLTPSQVVSLITGAKVIWLGPNSSGQPLSIQTGNSRRTHKYQMFIVMPQTDRNDMYNTDWYATLRVAAGLDA